MKAEEIARLLPDIFQRTVPRASNAVADPPGNVLMTLLRVMESHHSQVELTLAELQRYFLPDQTDDSFLPFLSQWVDLAWLVEAWDNPDPGQLYRLRTLLWEAAELSSRRGTRQGILRFLHLATGLSDFQIEESHKKPFHIIVTYPAQAEPSLVDLINLIVEQMKPAHVTFELRKSAGTNSQAGENK